MSAADPRPAAGELPTVRLGHIPPPAPALPLPLLPHLSPVLRRDVERLLGWCTAPGASDFARALLPSMRALLGFRAVDVAAAQQRAGQGQEAAATIALALHLMHPEPAVAPDGGE